MTTKPSSMCNVSHMTLENEQFFEEYNWWVETIGNLSFGCVGVFLNLATIIVLSSSTMLNNFFNRLLICLAVFDTLYLSCEISEVFRHRHHTFIQQQIFVYFTYPMRNIFMFSSVYMTVVLAFERYQAITNPVKYRSKMVGTSMNSHLISNVVPGFSFAVVYYIPKFLDLYVGEEKDCMDMEIQANNHNISQRNYLEPHLDRNCSINHVLIPTPLRLHPQYIFWYIIISNLTLTALLPSFVLIYLNARIVTSLKEFKDRKRSIKTSNSLNASVAETNKQTNSTKNTKTDLKKTFILFGIVILFVLCHSLRVALNVNEFIEIAAQNVASNGEVCRTEGMWKEYAGPFNQLLVIMNSSLNFFIYVFFDNAFQQVLRKHLQIKHRFLCTSMNRENTTGEIIRKDRKTTVIELNNINGDEV